MCSFCATFFNSSVTIPFLADALSLADEQLYEVKKLRKKDVAKIPLQA
jgi:hypothetical protein